MPDLPEPDDLYNYLDPRDSEALHSPEVMRAIYGIPGDVYDEIETVLIDDLMSVIPEAQSRGEYLDNVDIYQAQAPVDYIRDNLGYLNRSPRPIGPYSEGAEDLTHPVRFGEELYREIPTATSKPERPRTVAAAYDPKTNILTLVFRDGTFYNYYQISPMMWREFRSRPSKWRYIKDVLDLQPRGEANVADIPENVREALYAVARTAQMRLGGALQRVQPSAPKKPAKRAQQPRVRKPRAGINPATAGKNPAGKRGRPKNPTKTDLWRQWEGRNGNNP